MSEPLLAIEATAAEWHAVKLLLLVAKVRLATAPDKQAAERIWCTSKNARAAIMQMGD